MIDFRLPFDEPIFHALNAKQPAWVDGVMVLASSREFGALFLVMTALWLITGLRRHAVRPVLQAAIAYGLTDSIGSYGLKQWIGRIRPCYALPKGTFRQLVDAANSGALPSLHAANAFAVATAVSLVWPAAGRVLFPVATVIALSRIFVGVHWPSDVLAGIAWGSMVAGLVHLAGRRIGARDDAVNAAARKVASP